MSKGKESILFLINPKSGVQSKKNLPKLIETKIDKGRFDVSIMETRYVAHASELASEAAAQGVDAVVAVGGDGTVNEVARSLVGHRTALGIIPCGSGNGFARHVGIPVDVKGSIEFINRSQTVSVDYGKINGAPFFCTCGIGFDAFVSKSFAKGKQRGPIGYFHNMLIDWLNYKPEVYEIETETHSEHYNAFLIACGNASQYGNNAYIAPRASIKDGLLSVTILEPFTPFEVPLILSHMFGHRINSYNRVKTLESRWVRIRRKSAGVVHFDGEPTEMDAELFIEIVPSGLNVLAAPGWDGTSVPVPIHKQVADLLSSSLPNVDDIQLNIPTLPWGLDIEKVIVKKGDKQDKGK